MASFSSNTMVAILIAYALFCFTIPPTTSTTPNLRGGIPSLYMKVAPRDAPRVRGDAAAAAARGMQEMDREEPHRETHSFVEVMSALVAMMVLADRFPASRSPTRVATTASAVLILYTLLSFGIPPTMTITPRLRGGIPSLYMQPTLNAIGGLRGSAVAVTEGDEEDSSLCTFAFVEVLAVLVSMIALASKIPHRRSPPGVITTCSAILIAYVLFSFAVPPSMSTTPSVRGGTPSLYVQPAPHERGLRDGGGRRDSGISVAESESLHFGLDELSLRTFAEVFAVLLAIMSLAQRIPQSRSPSRMAITGSAILIAFTLFSFGIPPATSITPYVRGGIPSLYLKPTFTGNSGLRGASVDLVQHGMKSIEQDEAHYEAHGSFSDLTDTLSESFVPMAYWAALSVPAMAMTYLTQRKEHVKLQ